MLPFFPILANLVVVIHLAFAIFAALGAVLIIWRRWFLWLHLPALLWAVWIECTGGICPLTPLENWLRVKGGQGGYEGDFIATYLMPFLYPAGLTRNVQFILAMMVTVINIAIYGFIFYKRNLKKTN